MPCSALSNKKITFSLILTFIFKHIFTIDAIHLFKSEIVTEFEIIIRPDPQSPQFESPPHNMLHSFGQGLRLCPTVRLR